MTYAKGPRLPFQGTRTKYTHWIGRPTALLLLPGAKTATSKYGRIDRNASSSISRTENDKRFVKQARILVKVTFRTSTQNSFYHNAYGGLKMAHI